jgi:uncharacterized protein (TIGR03435 family)
MHLFLRLQLVRKRNPPGVYFRDCWLRGSMIHSMTQKMAPKPILKPGRHLGGLSLMVAGLLCASFAAQAQLTHEGPAKTITLAASLAPYDVVSVKPSEPPANPNEESWHMNLHEHIFTAVNMPLVMIVEFAYDIRENQIVGLVDPVRSAHFDIEAKVLSDGDKPPKLTDVQLRAMIIPLLGDRFHLKAHLEPRTQSVYELVVAHGGPKIQLSQEERTGSGWNINTSDHDHVLTSQHGSMADLANELSDEVERTVIDKTGLTGSADITVKWTMDDIPDSDGRTLSIFTAIQEQLGLKLQPAKGPVDTLVIDHVEMPSAN